MNHFLVAVAWMAVLHPAFAQLTAIDTDPHRNGEQAAELFWLKKYGIAAPLFRETQRQAAVNSPDEDELALAAQYYRAVCARQLHHPDAEQELLRVARKNKSPLTRRAAFELADVYFSRGNYSKALSWLKKVRPEDLDEDEQDRYRFQMAIGFFHQKDFRQAQPLLERLRSKQGPYYYPANYYYGYLQYRQGAYKEAVAALRTAAESPYYSPVVAYYLANIAFLQRRYDEVLALAEQASASPYAREFNRLKGKAYYAKKEYERALPLLLNHYQQTPKLPAADIYEVAYCQYQTGDYAAAIQTLQQLAGLSDSIGQHALFLIGDSRRALGQKAEARLAFERAASLNSDRRLQQQALLNFAKLSYELRYPDAAIRSLQHYLRQQGPEREEAQQLLIQSFLATLNYGAALDVARGIDQKTAEWRKIYQRIAYARATELFNEGQYEASMALLDESLANPVDPALVAGALFWKGECAYRMKRPQEAIALQEEFLDQLTHNKALPAGVSAADAHYSLGYSNLMLSSYAKALNHFQQATALLSQKADGAARYADARLRVADCEFVLSRYGQALNAYEQVVREKLPGSDYALFQSAVLQSLNNNRTEQIRLLRRLIQDHPKSAYLDDAWFELGNALLTVPAYQDALEAFQTVTSKYPRSLHVVQSRLKMGLIYFNMNREQEALEQYRWVLQRYPKTPEGSAALNAVKEIFTERADAQGYMAFVSSLPNVQVSDAVRDSVVYLSAENKYSRGDWAAAVTEFDAYVQQFPDGIFSVPAHFYRAECLARQNRFVEALQDYEYVISQPTGRFTEKALLQAGRISYVHLKDYPRALQHFLTLSRNSEFKAAGAEASRGAMYAAWQVGDWEEVIRSADRLLLLPHLSTDERAEAFFYRGRAYENRNNDARAEEDYRSVMQHTSSATGAEAGYRIAEIYFRRQQLETAEERCWDVIRLKPTHDYWVARSFLLLAAIYEQQGDLFQASATLQSLVDHYKGNDDIVPEAQLRLQRITERQQQGSKLDQEPEMESVQPKQPE
ncbi:MAG: tetratricopeptide repeat protein [Chitinophagales bacterium]|nr:tetratricopeptide repeat protein [Chitinophagales bacterium]MDW8394514.1 tetratricopeptide repeat protein [Chitinophagales bacterium]